LHAGHFALSFPGWPKMNILPMVLHMGHMPVVTFFGPVFMIFWVFRLPIIQKMESPSFKFSCKIDALITAFPKKQTKKYLVLRALQNG
jgi:hypothetical protein